MLQTQLYQDPVAFGVSYGPTETRKLMYNRKFRDTMGKRKKSSRKPATPKVKIPLGKLFSPAMHSS